MFRSQLDNLQVYPIYSRVLLTVEDSDDDDNDNNNNEWHYSPEGRNSPFI
jgi:hypothetical protein